MAADDVADRDPVRLQPRGVSRRRHVRVANINYKRCGWDEATRFHDFGPLLETLRRHVRRRPHILVLSEATMVHEFDAGPLLELVGSLNELWRDDDCYYWWLTNKQGSRNHPLLLTSAREITPIKWRTPGRNVRRPLEHTLLARIGSQEVIIKAEHWDGGSGPFEMVAQSARTAQLTTKPCIWAGDFNGTSSSAGEVTYPDWHDRVPRHKRIQKSRRGLDGRYRIDTEPLDYLLEAGWRDASAESQNFQPTTKADIDGGTGLNIDRILWSPALDATLVPGSHQVIPLPGSDHEAVVCTLAVS